MGLVNAVTDCRGKGLKSHWHWLPMWGKWWELNNTATSPKCKGWLTPMLGVTATAPDTNNLWMACLAWYNTCPLMKTSCYCVTLWRCWGLHVRPSIIFKLITIALGFSHMSIIKPTSYVWVMGTGNGSWHSVVAVCGQTAIQSSWTR